MNTRGQYGTARINRSARGQYGTARIGQLERAVFYSQMSPKSDYKMGDRGAKIILGAIAAIVAIGVVGTKLGIKWM